MPHDLVPIRRALLSVSDKTHLPELARALSAHGVELFASGGTLKTIFEAGVEVKEVSTLSQHGEAFGGRMKTLSFGIESAILFDRERDAAEAAQLGITPIDLVVCNFYPFEDRPEYSFEQLIELIDIGGPTMVRAAAKNHRSVAVLTNPADYTSFIDELTQNSGAVCLATRERLMRTAFDLTADYDGRIATALQSRAGHKTVRLTFEEGTPLRYGENSHQSAHYFREAGSGFKLRSTHGKELSYNNVLDLNAALDALRDLERPSVAIVKHGNACGLAESATLAHAFDVAWSSDPVSAFGSVIACNREVDLATAQLLMLEKPPADRRFVEAICAPSFSSEAAAYLQQSKNLRIVETPGTTAHPIEPRFVAGGMLLQDTDRELLESFSYATQPADCSPDEELALFGIKAVRPLKSNAIAIVRRKDKDTLQLLGMGTGQPNRLVSTQLAIDKCIENLTREAPQTPPSPEWLREQFRSTILVSDAFFPFSDCVEMAAEQGIQTVIQPGGSIRDQDVIDCCTQHNMAMVLTGRRHFKH